MMKKEPLISIVIPTYNRENIIEQTINSVLSQSYTNFEVIIVDDASKDRTKEIIQNIRDNRITYVKLTENSRGTKPRNVGIKLSKGEYIAFLDSDDEWLPDKLQKQISFILDSGMSRVLCFTGLIIDNGRSRIYSKNKPLNEKEDIMDYIFVGKNPVQTSTFMVSSNLAKETLFDPNLLKHQDWDFCLRLRNNRTNFLLLPEHLTIWRDDQRSERISNNYKNEEVSLNWMEKRKNELSTKSQWSFKVTIIVNALIERKESKKAVEILFQAFRNKSITLFTFINYLFKIFLPAKIHSELKHLIKTNLR